MSEEEKLPEGWDSTPLNDLVSRLTNGYVGATRGIYQEQGVPYLLSKHVRNNLLRFDNQTFITEEFNEKIRKSKLITGDVLLVQTGHVGESAVVPPEHDGHNCHAMIVITPRKELLDGYYLSYYFASPDIQRVFSGIEKGMTLRHLNCRDVIKADIKVPPLNEQRRIVAKIEALQERSRAAKEELDAIPPLLEKFRQSVLAAAFRGDLTRKWRQEHPNVEPASVLLTRIRKERKARFIEDESEKARAKSEAKARAVGKRWTAADNQSTLAKERAKAEKKYKAPEPVDASGLPELPEGWCWTKLEELATIKGGLTKGKKRQSKDKLLNVPYLRVANVQRGYLDLTEVKTIVATESEIDDLHLIRGDILFNEGGDRDKLGRGWVWDDEIDLCIHQNHVFRARLIREDVVPQFISHYGNSQTAQIYFLRTGKQTTNLASINMTQLKALPLPLAPLEEQIELVRMVDLHFLGAAESHGAATVMKELLTRLNQSILAKAFRGKLVPQDPNDEPASVLLERIRAERAAGEAEKKGKKKRKAAAKISLPIEDHRQMRDAGHRRDDGRAQRPAPMTETNDDHVQTAAYAGLSEEHHCHETHPAESEQVPFLDMDPDDQVEAVFEALWGKGPLTADEALRIVAEDLKKRWMTDFKRLRKDGPLSKAIASTIKKAVKYGHLDKPTWGKIRAVMTDPNTYSPKDWAMIAEQALRDIEVESEEQAIRHCAEWARDNCGLEFERIRKGGVIWKGLNELAKERR
ncbi:MAG: hypothetical protein GY847_07195 [Proteobacteria bacterium]|nr:hypothetical protein [Pseudomonadota bacterium]